MSEQRRCVGTVCTAVVRPRVQGIEPRFEIFFNDDDDRSTDVDLYSIELM